MARRPKLHISQCAKRVRMDLGRKVEVNRVTGRVGNATVTVDVAHGTGYLRRMVIAKQLIHSRLGVPYQVDNRDVWHAMMMPGGW